ncbi:MAG TPA: helix-turn-helix domain-containing protein [Chitinophagaceae bacterium]
METGNIQVVLFQHIKSLLPAHIAMVDAIADILNISNDSAYRRIRGDKPITPEEMQKLAIHYKISLDQLMHLQSNSFIFTGHLTNASDHPFQHWMQDTLQQLTFMNSFKNKHMYYLAKDIPAMHYFALPEFWAFKSFVWKKSILHLSELKDIKFSIQQQIGESYPALARKMVETYNEIPSTEIWNIECINTSLRQLEFYRTAGIFLTKDDYAISCNSFLLLIDHMEKQAELGLKYVVGESPKSNAAPYRLFNNEFQLGDNTVLAELDNMKVTFLNHSVFNFVGTRDERFNNYMHDNLTNLIRKSTQISEVGERDRIKFFNRIRERIKSAVKL